jgi:hypothetical protein
MAMNRTIPQQSTYVDHVANLATALANLIDEDAHALLLDWFQGMNNLLTDPAAFAGTEYDKAKVTAMMTTIGALNSLMDAGHRTNIYDMKK